MTIINLLSNSYVSQLYHLIFTSSLATWGRLQNCEKRNRCRCRFGRRQVTRTGLKCKFGRTINARFAEAIILRLCEDRAIPNFEILQFFLTKQRYRQRFCFFQSNIDAFFDDGLKKSNFIDALEFVNLERQSYLNNNGRVQETTVNLVMWLYGL